SSPHGAIGAARAWRSSPRRAEQEGSAMARKDRRGRPVVAVTGIGVVTSLGRGLADNWAALTEGRSGIHRITRFDTDHLLTTSAGAVDFLHPEPVISPVLSESLASGAGEEAVTMAGIGTAGSFPGPLFMAVPPVELEWP